MDCQIKEGADTLSAGNPLVVWFRRNPTWLILIKIIIVHPIKFPEFLRIIICWRGNFLNIRKSFTYNENGYRTSCGPGPRVGIHCLSACSRQSSWISILEFTFFHDAPDAWNSFTVRWGRGNGWNTCWSWRKFLQKFKTSTSYCFLCSLLLSLFSFGRSNGARIRNEMTH